MTNQNIKQSNTEGNWKTIASLITGSISMIPIILVFSSSGLYHSTIFGPKILVLLSSLSIIGLFWGIKGLKAAKKKLAIGGIIFSIIGILGLILILFVWWLHSMDIIGI